MKRMISIFMIILSIFISFSCAKLTSDLTTTSLTTATTTTTTTTTYQDLHFFSQKVEEFLVDFNTFPTWSYESVFHLYETGHATDEGSWYSDRLEIDFSIPYAYRFIRSDPTSHHWEFYPTYLNEVYEEVNGCLASRKQIGLNVSFDRFLSESTTRESMNSSLPFNLLEIFGILHNDQIERIEENHYRVNMTMDPFKEFSEYIILFDKYLEGVSLDYTLEDILFDVYFEEDQLRIVAMKQYYSNGSKKYYDYSTTIYVQHIEEVTKILYTIPVNYICLPNDPRLISISYTAPTQFKVYLFKNEYSYLKVEFEPGRYSVSANDTDSQYGFTFIKVFDENLVELPTEAFTVTDNEVYYIQLQCLYEDNITNISIEPRELN